MGAITEFADYSGTVAGTTKVTSATHGLAAGTTVVLITGTTSYNGVFEAVYIDANNFYIVVAFVADDATGTWARAAYAPNSPLSSTVMSSSTEQLRANWEIIEDWWAVEHGDPSSATSGAHAIGRVGAMLVDATSGISAVSSPGTGSIAINTTLGEMQIYRYDSVGLTAGWEGITDQDFARIRQGMGAQTIAASTWTQVVCAATAFSGSYDGLSEWATYKYTATGTGYYHISIQARWPITSSNYSKAVAIYVNGTRRSVKRLYGSAIRHLMLSDTLYLTATQYVQVYVYHSHTVPVDLVSAVMHVTRVS